MFAKLPILVVVFFLIFGGGRILPFLFFAFALWFVFGFVGQAFRYERRSNVTAEDLSDLRNSVAVDLLDLDDDLRLVINDDAKTHFEAAGAHYTKAADALDRGVRRRDRDRVANTLYRARYELEATSAILDGRAAPDIGTPRPQVKVAVRPSYRRRHACYRW